jgi:hypothetical protein
MWYLYIWSWLSSLLKPDQCAANPTKCTIIRWALDLTLKLVVFRVLREMIIPLIHQAPLAESLLVWLINCHASSTFTHFDPPAIGSIRCAIHGQGASLMRMVSHHILTGTSNLTIWLIPRSLTLQCSPSSVNLKWGTSGDLNPFLTNWNRVRIRSHHKNAGKWPSRQL